jgi:hypothetical protein
MQAYSDEELNCIKNSKSFRLQDPAAKSCVFFYLAHDHDAYLAPTHGNCGKTIHQRIENRQE